MAYPHDRSFFSADGTMRPPEYRSGGVYPNAVRFRRGGLNTHVYFLRARLQKRTNLPDPLSRHLFVVRGPRTVNWFRATFRFGNVRTRNEWSTVYFHVRNSSSIAVRACRSYCTGFRTLLVGFDNNNYLFWYGAKMFFFFVFWISVR